MRYRTLSSRAAMAFWLLAVSVAIFGSPVGAGSAAAQDTPIDWGDPLAPSGSIRTGDAPDSTEAPVLFAFQRDQAGLEALAAEVSYPSSSAYGEHLSVEELAELYGVSADDRLAFEEGLVLLGADPSVDVTGAFADPTLTVGQLEALLGVTFGTYDVSGTDVIAPDSLPTTAPPALVGVTLVRGLDIQAVGSSPSPPLPTPPTPTGDYPTDGGTPYRTGEATGCPDALALPNPVFEGQGSGLAPNQIKAAYGIDELHEQGITGDGVRLALVESGPFRSGDLAAFQECFGIVATAPVVHGSQPESAAGVEASLDIEILSMVAPDAERFDVFLNPLDQLWQFAPFLSAPLDTSQTDGLLPHIVSVSYGVCEPDFAGDHDVVELTEQVLATGAAAGVGYYVAAGDSGSSGCYHNDGVTTTLATGYPSTSQWVTSVGGTDLTLADANSIAGQGVWNTTVFFEPPQNAGSLGAGGGGASTIMSRPSWQHGPGVPAGTERLNPDVALFADVAPGWIMYCTIPDTGFCPTTGWVAVGGTSAATPLMAGIAALVTQATNEEGLPPLGFSAPLLYELARDGEVSASVFRDVVLGQNDMFGVGCCTAGPGYDLASGWGSVDAVGLMDAVVPPATAPEALVVPRFTG